mgnify:FL=1
MPHEIFYRTLTEAANVARDCGKRDTECDSWAGGSFDKAYDLATKGWPEGATMASKIVGKIVDRAVASASMPVMTTEVAWDVQGAAYDTGAYLAGVPECWGTFAPVEAKRGVRLVCNMSVSAGVPKEAITSRGLAMTALAMLLQSHGYPVTIDVCAFWNYRSRSDLEGRVMHVVRLADAESGSILDFDRITYALAHPTMVRRLGFTLAYADGCPTGSNMGAPVDVPPSGAVDLFIGGAYLRDVERWQDGGESWVLAEYLKQTTGV